ncbi:MAG: energy transducer TonB [Telluria sp.]
MTTTSVHGVPYTIPPEPNRVPAIVIALLVHAGLLGFLWVGIRWQNVEPIAVEAEVWDMKTEAAAPPPPPQPQVQPVRPPEPVPVPKVVPPPPPPKVIEPVAPKAPDIALEREKEKKKLLEKKLAEEKVAKEKSRQLAELEAKQKEEADKEKKALADKKLADKAKADKLAKAAKDAAEAKQTQALRDQEMKRMMGNLGGSGEAAKSTAPRIDSSYVAAITGKIKRSTSYNGDTDVDGNPRATFKIEQLPTGEIISVRKTESSGIAAFDDAVERGINNSSPLPKKKDGTVERSIEVSILMKELN